VSWRVPGGRHGGVAALLCLLLAGCRAGATDGAEDPAVPGAVPGVVPGVVPTAAPPASSAFGSFPYSLRLQEPGEAQRVLVGDPTAADLPAAGPPPAGWPTFVDAAAELGVSFSRFSGASGRKYSCEPKGGGIGFIDVDGDGWPDLYLLDGGHLPGTPPRGERGNRLLRNRQGGGFVDVTAAAGVAGPWYSMGVAAGDYDGDGDVDLFVTSLDGTVLYQNRGDGTFADVTATTGAAVPGWSTTAVFVDLDEDGFLDLYVARYLRYHPRDNPPCYAEGIFNYCTPHDFPPISDVVLRNVSGRKFEDVSATWLGPHTPSPGLMVAAADLDRDGHQDVYVANDEVPNLLWMGDGTGRLREEALFRGVAVGAAGIPEAGMGVDIGDLDGDRTFDIAVSNFANQSANDFRNDGRGVFLDLAERSGVFHATYPPLQFGVRMADLDNDGDLDLHFCNGHIFDTVATFQPGMAFPQQNSLLRNEGGGRFVDLSSRSGSGLLQRRVSRGVAAADLDQDGDVDLAIANQDSPVVVLRNDGGHRLPWLQVQLLGQPPNTAALGALVELHGPGGVQVRQVTTGGGYQSASEPVVHFGLGAAGRVDRLVIRWPPPARGISELDAPPVNQRLRVGQPSRP